MQKSAQNNFPSKTPSETQTTHVYSLLHRYTPCRQLTALGKKTQAIEKWLFDCHVKYPLCGSFASYLTSRETHIEGTKVEEPGLVYP
jgi:hypothetical protein